jgi:uncharacterized membrane protein
VGLVLFVNALWAIGQVFWKKAMGDVAGREGLGAVLRALFRDPNFYLGGCTSTVGILLWFVVLAKADLSFASPLVGTGILFAALFSVLLLHEPVSPLRVAGALCIAVGVALVARS